MTSVLIFNAGIDTGGQGYQLAKALNQHAEGWTATAVRRKDSWIHYPADVTWPKNDSATERAVQRRAAQVDVIHVMQVPHVIRHLGRVKPRRIVVQHHGTYFRQQPAGVSRACRSIGALEVAVDYGLLAMAPRAQLLPVVVDLDLMTALRAEHYEPTERVRIFHSPTNRALKQTDRLIAAVERLAAHYPVELVIVEGASWMDCLRAKATADIVFDQVEYGYGINAVEAMGMSIPVVAGIADPKARQMMLDDWGALPFAEATADTIAETLEPLVADAAYRAVVGRAGRLHAERVHAPAAVAHRYMALVGEAVAA